MDAYEDLALIALVVLVMGAGLAATIIVFAGAGAASGYVAGRRAPSSTGRSGAKAGLTIGAVAGVLEYPLLVFISDPALVILILIMGALSVVLGAALFAYRRDLSTLRIIVLLALGAAVVAVPVAGDRRPERNAPEENEQMRTSESNEINAESDTPSVG